MLCVSANSDMPAKNNAKREKAEDEQPPTRTNENLPAADRQTVQALIQDA